MKSFFLFLALIATPSREILAEASHLFNATDAIEMSRFSSLDQTDEHFHALFSPDGAHFVVVTSRGIIDNDSIESSLWVYNTRDIQRTLRMPSPQQLPPHRLATASAIPQQVSYFAYSSIIVNVQWAPDSNSIYFLSQADSGNRRLYRVYLSAAKPTPLTPADQDVINYVPEKETVIYVAVSSKRQRQYVDTLNRPLNRDVINPDGVPLANILFPHQGYEPEITELWIWQRGKVRHVSRYEDELPEQLIHDPLDKALSLSPSGRYIVQLRTIENVPDRWSAYEPAPSDQHLRVQPGKQSDNMLLGVGFLKQYVITDVKTGKSESLVNAPAGRSFGYFAKMQSKWSADGTFLLLTNTYLPLVDDPSMGSGKMVYPCLAAVVDISTRNAECLQHYSASRGTESMAFTSLEDAHFVAGGIALSFRGSEGFVNRFYQYSGNHWFVTRTTEANAMSRTPTEQTGSPDPAISVRVRESLNEPPVLEATDPATGRAMQLWNPNPQFKNVRWGEASVFHWKDQTGHEWSGGLIKPVDYVPGRRYPLVIQMYTFHDEEFMTDGMAPTAMPARAIASAGMFYLQASKQPGHTWNQQEAQVHLDGVLSAIDALDAQGLIDPQKVGIIGFSFTTWYVEHELVNAPNRFAAATIAEGADNGYSQYLFWGIANPQLREQMEAINGGPPFGSGLNKWVENTPAFHLDQVQTPIRIEAMTPGSLIGEWELYASLRLQHKPADLIYYPEGQHQLQRPLERLASAQGNIDWFRFWLQGYEDPSKPLQYQRWLRMRRMNPTTSVYSSRGDNRSR